ncbi:hypothetical protein B0F89_13232 [Malaciobacter marinus]|jgi:hypothetical protein|uniref:Dolichyl-phosphate-mannose-protein mannosyltransferase n=1 Tax=Malaciobacter marinus TaxID=505249 RepID=A0AB36ZWX3_9BACT|nr:glycosyltransferase family 39 protein [Malaciobacter marinus]PPK59397.1 hypothetical protein B0F89_13232 [Malaciobacter marinus]
MFSDKVYWLLVIILVSIISFYFFWISGFNYFFDDVYVYLSYSESLYNLGYVQDLTTIPPTAPITTQNGVVLLYTILNYVTNDMLTKMQIVSFILTINLMICYLLIYKIGLLLNISKNVLYILIVALIFNFYFYGYYVTPTNDGFYISLLLLSLYLFLKLSIKNNTNYWMILLVIALLVPMFRLQGLIVYIAALISFFIIQKEYKKSFIIFIYIVLSFLAVKLSIKLLIDDTSGLEELSKMLIFYHLETFYDSFQEILANAIPSIFLNFPASNFNSDAFVYIKILFSALVFIFLIAIFIESFKKKNLIVFTIVLIVFGNFAALILFNVIIDRYIYINAIFIILLSLFYMKRIYHMYFVVGFLLLSLLSFGARIYYKQYDSINVINNIDYIDSTYKSYNLISQFPRQTYFYLRKQSILNQQYIDTNLPILIIGDEKFTNHQIEILIQKKNKIITKKQLTLIWKKENTLYNTTELYIKDNDDW